MEKTYTWEEDFLGDDSVLLLDGVKLGEVSPLGLASWEVKYGSEVIAVRPDKQSAQRTLIKYHEVQSSPGRPGSAQSQK